MNNIRAFALVLAAAFLAGCGTAGPTGPQPDLPDDNDPSPPTPQPSFKDPISVDFGGLLQVTVA
ncbi:MAG: hypothetical protein H0U67_00925 [Gemmatimonadetes bacterium]|nr:hypothetical protein [Gemmatimonadota bacterium]MBA4158724.1 hypothetical protein [Gemmatimonadota bacterium]